MLAFKECGAWIAWSLIDATIFPFDSCKHAFVSFSKYSRKSSRIAVGAIPSLRATGIVVNSRWFLSLGAGGGSEDSFSCVASALGGSGAVFLAASLPVDV
eukprot:CAMPEP_0177424182 /NCGR_PEP_ID=MMETSP0368-20130122/72302_1 /TAXON_ID=447022 ORGANISM="Scrippsiella hangoei-like, Strain SHHI-4" /NCGR_SAMPLE_ID=MMETSP0368 /ASSEMBLY_ACC=CAM_ASM_000363 /LENGTH=99 /DNA_ID=CAMNT_0018894323 /DNA_START=149 /DNA_END=448 /DNA_ORIENTATION=+